MLELNLVVGWDLSFVYQFLLAVKYMQNSKILVLGNYKFILNYNYHLSYERYSCESYTGLIFINKDDSTYDVVNNYLMGYRLLINNKDGVKDIPFKHDTFRFLPDGIIVEEL